MSNYCGSCGGRIGQDCWNPSECAWITQQMEFDAQMRAELYREEQEYYRKEIELQYNQALELDYYNHIKFDPISLGM